jgi:poly(3-hydroxybutyrate) depolymerase
VLAFASLVLVAAASPVALKCPRGYELIDDTCAVLPKQPKALVVYFHGMLPGPTDFSRTPELVAMGAQAKRAGVLLVAPRGEQGLCLWSKDVLEHWCWPNDKSQLRDVGRLLERVGQTLAKVLERAKAPPGLGAPVYAGFSNGGYFTSMIASDTQAAATGYAVLHAGNVLNQTFSTERARPTLLVAALRDVYQLPTMKSLQALLDEAQWAPHFVVRDGVHEVTAADAKQLCEFAVSLNERKTAP